MDVAASRYKCAASGGPAAATSSYKYAASSGPMAATPAPISSQPYPRQPTASGPN